MAEQTRREKRIRRRRSPATTTCDLSLLTWLRQHKVAQVVREHFSARGG